MLLFILSLNRFVTFVYKKAFSCQVLWLSIDCNCCWKLDTESVYQHWRRAKLDVMENN